MVNRDFRRKWTGAGEFRYAFENHRRRSWGTRFLAAPKSSTEDLSLTHAEAMALMTAYRFGPLTTYRLRRLYAEAPVASFSNSTGTVYPVVRRLTARGLIDAQPVEGSRRGAETLACTDIGRRALKAWVMSLGKEEAILTDTARSKLSCFTLLTPAERVEWAGRLLANLAEATQVLDEFFGRHKDTPFIDLLQDNFVSTLESRRAWAERVRRSLVDQAG